MKRIKSTIRRIVAACLSTAILAAASMPSMAQGNIENEIILPLVLPADAASTGFVRIRNANGPPRSGTVRIFAIDDTGSVRLGRDRPVTLSLDAGETVNLNSRDLEQGNPSKGLPVGVGDGNGNWWLSLETDLNIYAAAYIRTPDGFVTAMHDVVSALDVVSSIDEESVYIVHYFNPGSNMRQISRLRLINTQTQEVTVTIIGVDDAGDSAPGGNVRLTLPAGHSRMLTAQQLELGGAGISGRLGDGKGKWTLVVEASPVSYKSGFTVMSLLTSPTGHLSNVSTVAATEGFMVVSPPEPEYVCPAESVIGAPGTIIEQRGPDGVFRYRILPGNRYVNTADPTDTGTFTYRRTTPNTAAVTSTDRYERCDGVFTCTTMTTGTFRTNCDEFGVGPYTDSGTWEIQIPTILPPESVVDLAIRDAQARWVGRNSFEGSVTIANLGGVPAHPKYGVEIAQDNHDGTFGVVVIPFGGPAIPPGSERTARHIFETLSRTNPDGEPIYPVGGSVEICFGTTVPLESAEQSSNNCVTVTVEGE